MDENVYLYEIKFAKMTKKMFSFSLDSIEMNSIIYIYLKYFLLMYENIAYILFRKDNYDKIKVCFEKRKKVEEIQ